MKENPSVIFSKLNSKGLIYSDTSLVAPQNLQERVCFSCQVQPKIANRIDDFTLVRLCSPIEGSKSLSWLKVEP